MVTCWFIVIESMGSWWVDCEGKAYGPFDTREDAQSEARRIAVTYGDDSRRSQVFSAEPDGTHRLIWTAPTLGN
jgi:hypothetical protein